QETSLPIPIHCLSVCTATPQQLSAFPFSLFLQTPPVSLSATQQKYVPPDTNSNKYSFCNSINNLIDRGRNSLIQGIEKTITVSINVFASAPFAIAYACCLFAAKFVDIDEKTIQRINFSMTAPWRANDYNEINYANSPCLQKELKKSQSNAPGKLYLGAMPVHNRGMFNKMVESLNLTSIEALNELFETKEMWNSKPVTEKDWESKGIDYNLTVTNDHQLVSHDNLESIGKSIKETLLSGKNVYVHCRAGRGRSAMGVAAALIMMGATAEEAANIIKESRPSSTIMKKLDDKIDKNTKDVQQGLRSFEKNYRSTLASDD
ncbi:MAG: dual specificity protein phosphatase family protein, partial [Chlamydiota bacterium]